MRWRTAPMRTKFVKDSCLTISAYNVCFYDSNGTDEIQI